MVRLLFVLLLAASSGVFAQAVHDFDNLPEARNLQTPKAVTGDLPKNVDGSVDWVRALEKGAITPRATRTGEPRPAEVDIPMPKEGIVFSNTQFMPYVVFPHQPHAEWLSCMNCHDTLFELKATGRGKGMNAIFRGEHCGACHGRVAFSPEGSCYRCHSRPNPAAAKNESPFVAPAVVEKSAPDASEKRPRRGSRGSSRAPGLMPSIVSPPGASEQTAPALR